MQSEYRALVVEDEEPVRKLAVRALSKEGFQCDSAGDGLEATELLMESPYHVVVTDLRMPRENGHALATKILARRPRPVIIILTGVLEPSLAKDLIARGVDEIAFKPVDYREFALKVKQLVRDRPNGDVQSNNGGPRKGWLGWFSARFGGLTPEQCLPALELLDAQGPLSLEQLRDRAIVSLALQGLTPVELSDLKVEDVQLSDRFDSVSVLRNGGIRFATRLSYQTGQCLRDYLQSFGHHREPDAFLLRPLPGEASCDEAARVPSSTIESVLTQYVISVK